jgi:peptidoglycan hydrolase-like protein with peptidoglycan-binding domain
MTVTSTAAQRIGLGASTDPQHVEVGVGIVPELVSVRVDGHPAFDRLVLELDGELPGYDVRYVQQVLRPATGEPVALRGRAILRVAVVPSSTFTDEGSPVSPASPTGLAAVRDVVGVSDESAVVTYGIGVAARTPFLVRRVALSLISIDVMHAAPGTGAYLLRVGARGAAVATWQWRLHLALSRTLAVDEVFGPATEAATRDFQRAQHLDPDGIVGPRSRTAMERVLGV